MKILMAECSDFIKNPLSRLYKKPNFKLIFDPLKQTMPNLWYWFRRLIAEIMALIKESTEGRILSSLLVSLTSAKFQISERTPWNLSQIKV